MGDGNSSPSLYAVRPLRRRYFNRIFAFLYLIAITSIFYRHVNAIIHGKFVVTTLLLILADAFLAFIWITSQSFRMNPIDRKEFPENLRHHIDLKEFPAIDIFICTADPYKEPPIVVVTTALSVMAYDYPAEKISVYVSDDGGSEMTLFALMEAAKFAKVWLPFCRENNIKDRNPEVYFNSAPISSNKEIKNLYEDMKSKIETNLNHGRVSNEYITEEHEHEILRQFAAKGFTKQDHPSVIQVLLNLKKDKDTTGGPMPNLIYVAREKRTGTVHHFKAGALNVLLRVSASMTNSPILLTLDCDMFSNDPITAQRALIYLNKNSKIRPNCGYVQFPQIYHGINKNDIYNGEVKIPFRINKKGIDGINGPNYVGTGCFFLRRVFFGGPSSYIKPENLLLDPNHNVEKAIDDPTVLTLAKVVASCEYENQKDWGSEIGFFYGSLVEDYYTGYRLQCRGWRSIFCDPERPAFLGDAPISLMDSLGQIKRWCIGLLEVGFSEFSPLTFGVKYMGLLMGFAYGHYAFWSARSIPVAIYAFLPPLALLRGTPIFPKVEDGWFMVYLFLFLGSYCQECFEYVSKQGTFARWFNSQRIWMIHALTSHLFGFIEFTTKWLGIATHGFTLTSKVSNDDQRKRYDQGMFEFGVHSPMLLPLFSAAILNLIAFTWGAISIITKGIDGSKFFIQMAIAGFAIVNSIPFYEAIAFRRDEGRIPRKTSAIALLIVAFLYGIAYILY